MSASAGAGLDNLAQGLAVVCGVFVERDHLALGRKHDPGQDQAVGLFLLTGLAPDLLLRLVVQG